MRRSAISFLSVALLAGGLRTAVCAAGDDLAAVAETFARRFLDGQHEANLALMTDEMRAASGAGPSEALRGALVGQHGAVGGVGRAWPEDRVQGYQRYRVPVRFAQGTLDFRVVFDDTGRLAGFFVVPHAEPPEAETGGPGRRIDVQVGEGATALPGTLILPEGPGPFPAVVLVHGSGPQDRDETIGPNRPFRDLAYGLAERGIASLRYDKRSHARPADLVAVGEALTVEHEVIADARLAFGLLRRRAEIDAERLYVIGHSLGGTLAPRIAAEAPRPAGIVTLAGATLPLPEKMLEQTRHVAAQDGVTDAAEQARIAALEETVRALRAALDGAAPAPASPVLGAPFAYYRDLERHDPPVEAAALGLPILVLQGERDYQVTLEDFGRWQAALAGKPFACLASYPDIDHLFRPGSGPSGPADYDRRAPVAPRVIADIAAWILERRCPAREAGTPATPAR